MNQPAVLRRVRTSVLEIAYEESGPTDGVAVLLMHGFPYDPRTYDEVLPQLVEAGCRVIVPYLRGYGATRFLASDTLRSGQQRRWATTSRSSSTRSRSSAPCSPATTGAGAPPASSPCCGPSAYSAWSPPTATTSRTLPGRLNQRRRSRSTGFGINTTFTPNGAAPDCMQIAASFVDCCGGYGRRIGGSMTPPTTAPPCRSIIRILSRL